MFSTPIALFIFNRPDTTAQVFDVVRDARPARLLIVADGPRLDHPTDAERCAAARAVVDRVDWPCQVSVDNAPRNLGAGRRIASGLAWVFEQVDEAVILEDDCLPDPSFFPYCAALLTAYRHDKRVSHIAGANPLGPTRADRQSYHFSLYGQHWGWATWRRAWCDYDYNIQALDQPETRARLLEVTGDAAYTDYHLRLCQQVAQGRLDTWDAQWSLGQLLQGRLSIVPSVNLITNIGFGPHATHTRLSLALAAQLQRRALTFPLTPPAEVTADPDYDRAYAAWRLGRPSIDHVIEVASGQLAAGRYSQPLLLLEAALRAASPMTAEQRADMIILKARALAALGQSARALAAAREALALVPDCPEAAALLADLEG